MDIACFSNNCTPNQFHKLMVITRPALIMRWDRSRAPRYTYSQSSIVDLASRYLLDILEIATRRRGWKKTLEIVC